MSRRTMDQKTRNFDQILIYCLPTLCDAGLTLKKHWVNHGTDIWGDRQPFQCADRLYTSESDVYRRQILTYKDDPRTERMKIMAVDP